MGTVVHFVEFIMMSLMGIMLYKLYTSYMCWKNVSAFSSSVASEKPITYSRKAETSDFLSVTKVNVAVATESVTSNRAMQGEPTQKLAIDIGSIKSKSAKLENAEKKSSAILNDYIGEFFTEHKTLDINPFRAQESLETTKNTMSPAFISKSDDTNDNKSEDEIIKVEPLFIVSDAMRSKAVLNSAHSSTELVDIEDDIPTLNELNDLESDSFITVASINHEIENGNKVMSDKVVLAMLDEAKLVCAS